MAGLIQRCAVQPMASRYARCTALFHKQPSMGFTALQEPSIMVMEEIEFGREVTKMKKLEEYVRSIPDFPEPGIIFRDVTSILQDADGLCLAVDSLIDMVKDLDYDLVVGPESRGFIFGVPVAYAQHKGNGHHTCCCCESCFPLSHLAYSFTF